MNANYYRFGFIILAATISSGCATVTRGTKQNFQFLSEPNGAAVTTTNGISCMTPCAFKLKRKEAFTATFKKFGYATQTANVRSKFSGGGAAAGAGNILIGGIIGAGVDASNGSLNRLSPSPLKVVLQPIFPPVAVELKPVDAALPVAEAMPVPEGAPVMGATQTANAEPAVSSRP